MKYHLVTLGCQMNKSDSERVTTVIEKMGYQWTDSEEEASLLGILACSVRQKAIDKVYNKIHKWNKKKDQRNLVTFVSGCVLPADRTKFLKLFDFVFEMSELPQFPEMLSQYGVVTPFRLTQEIAEPTQAKEKAPAFSMVSVDTNSQAQVGDAVVLARPEEKIKGFWDIKPEYNSAFEAFIPIQNGCDKFCTYCAVPYTRGREISRPSEEILEELKGLVEKGFKTITLLGQNVNSYGLDKKGKEISFAELLRKIGEFGNQSQKDFWVYFTSPHPRDMTNDVLEAIADYDCLAKQIHLPLQAGDDKVLIRMNRKHNLNDFRKIMHSIREILPTATVFTDIIVGFTSETEEQFMNTARAMEEFRFNMAYIARYSPRPGAASSRWDDDVSHADKRDRLHRLSDLLAGHSAAHNQEMIGKEYKVLVTGSDRKGGHLSGLTEGKIIVRFAHEDKSLMGKFVKVKITSAADFATEGELLEVYNSEMIEA